MNNTISPSKKDIFLSPDIEWIEVDSNFDYNITNKINKGLIYYTI